MYRLEKCALCRESSELVLSHIVPKMVVRKLKKTSVGGIRSSLNPNKRVQDSEKHYMLCAGCEELFSAKETYFANTLFHPYIENREISFEYNENLFYCLTSISWKSLYLDLIDYVENNIVGIEALEQLVSCEKIMRDYLLNKTSDIFNIENHIYFFENIKEINGNLKEHISSMNPHTTFHRGITSYSVCYEKLMTYATVTNMMGIILVTLYSKGEDEMWINTKIENGDGKIVAEKQQITSAACSEFLQILETQQKSFDATSEVQQEKINDNLKSKGEDIKNYAIFNDWINDYRLSDE